jgi:hypothetical protein
MWPAGVLFLDTCIRSKEGLAMNICCLILRVLS